MLPFIIGGMVRLITTSFTWWTWDTFSASELLICLGFLCLFISQTLPKSKRDADTEELKTYAEAQGHVFLVGGVILFVLFGLVTAFGTIVEVLHDKNLVGALFCSKLFSFASLPLVLSLSIRAQRSFKLKAAIT